MTKEPAVLLNSIKVIVTPWDKKGFTCGIIDDQNHMTNEEHELCTTICRGMIYRAMKDPHETFLDGMKGFAEDRKNKSIPKNIECIAESTHDAEEAGEVIDFIEALKERRDKQLS